MPETLLQQVAATIERHQLLNKGDRIVVGVSGGMDSMVLLHVLHAFRENLRLELIVAHVNHGLRPAESEKEAELVERESRWLGYPFEYGQFDVRQFQKESGYSPQDAARKIRFHFFNHLIAKHEAQKLALGHNADDQVETILLRLIRGSGLRGLKGMLPIREGRVVRPLLDVWREEIESFTRERGIPYLVDSSNLKEKYLRNRIRLKLIPSIEKEVQPNFKQVVLRSSAILRAEDDYLSQKTEEIYETMIQGVENALVFSYPLYQSLPEAIRWRLLEKLLGKFQGGEGGSEEGEWVDIFPIYQRLNSRASSFLMEYPRGLTLEKRYNRVILGRGKVTTVPPFEVELLKVGRTLIQDIQKEVMMEDMSWKGSAKAQGSPTVALVDYHALQFPLKMRNFRPGDRFHPLGSRGTQKLKEFFIDHKVPRFDRPKIPLLISGETIAWVVGHRISERVKVTETTKRVLRIEVRGVSE
jgi:tRNA(Ile)-lysidine synthase